MRGFLFVLIIIIRHSKVFQNPGLVLNKLCVVSHSSLIVFFINFEYFLVLNFFIFFLLF